MEMDRTEARLERQFERNERRRFAAEARAFDRHARQSREADALVGQLMTEGVLGYYINVRNKSGALTGAIRRFDTHSNAVSFLIRNRYV